MAGSGILKVGLYAMELEQSVWFGPGAGLEWDRRWVMGGVCGWIVLVEVGS